MPQPPGFTFSTLLFGTRSCNNIIVRSSETQLKYFPKHCIPSLYEQPGSFSICGTLLSRQLAGAVAIPLGPIPVSRIRFPFLPPQITVATAITAIAPALAASVQFTGSPSKTRTAKSILGLGDAGPAWEPRPALLLFPRTLLALSDDITRRITHRAEEQLPTTGSIGTCDQFLLLISNAFELLIL